MLFNSFDFGFFLIIVYSIYWIIGAKRRKLQNIILLISSYIFYGFWDWRFLSLLLLSFLIDYIAARGIENTKRSSIRKLYLWGSVFWNIGVLIAFKYFNFFLDSFSSLFSLDLQESGYSMWKIIVPVGLSFYTFQTISYTVDVYRKKINPTPDLNIFRQNTKLFFDMIHLIKERNLNIVICHTPVYRTYLAKRNADILRRRDSIVELILEEHPEIRLLNKEEDTIQYDVYDFTNQSHLNSKGVKLFSKALNELLNKD